MEGFKFLVPKGFFLLFFLIISKNVESNQPWYETQPAVAMDYKVHIDAGKEDCYFQYVNPGATFYVSFQVSFFNVILFLHLA